MSQVTRTEFDIMVRKVDELVDVLKGKRNDLGLVARVQIIWRTYVGLIGLLSAAGGSLVTFLIMKALGQ